jgi:hypothetical protein
MANLHVPRLEGHDLPLSAYEARSFLGALSQPALGATREQAGKKSQAEKTVPALSTSTEQTTLVDPPRNQE